MKKKFYVPDVPFNRIHNADLIGKVLRSPPSYTMVIPFVKKAGTDALDHALAQAEYDDSKRGCV